MNVPSSQSVTPVYIAAVNLTKMRILKASESEGVQGGRADLEEGRSKTRQQKENDELFGHFIVPRRNRERWAYLLSKSTSRPVCLSTHLFGFILFPKLSSSWTLSRFPPLNRIVSWPPPSVVEYDILEREKREGREGRESWLEVGKR
jgi:hypothetical protein